MLEDIESAQGELQRADHMIYVTLKYTRTGDVIKNIVERLVGSMNYTITDMLEYAKSKNKLKEVPTSDIAKLELLNTVLKPLFAKNKALKEQIDLYMVLKRVSKGVPEPLPAPLLIPATTALVQVNVVPGVALVGV